MHMLASHRPSFPPLNQQQSLQTIIDIKHHLTAIVVIDSHTSHQQPPQLHVPNQQSNLIDETRPLDPA